MALANDSDTALDVLEKSTIIRPSWDQTRRQSEKAGLHRFMVLGLGEIQILLTGFTRITSLTSIWLN